MQFIVIAYDGTDEKALERRMAVRENHLKYAQEMFDAGKWLYATAILDDNDKMIGSMIVCDYPSKEDLNEHWLKNEVYVTGDVWRTINIHRARVAKH